VEFLVKITPRAERDIADLFQEINAEHSDAALDWYFGLRQAILRLRAHPNRCAITRKRDGLRHLLYGHKPHVYCVIFRIIERECCVEVLHIRHGARRSLKPADLK
jgi:plasmid stabilization system protein ParE